MYQTDLVQESSELLVVQSLSIFRKYKKETTNNVHLFKVCKKKKKKKKRKKKRKKIAEI